MKEATTKLLFGTIILIAGWIICFIYESGTVLIACSIISFVYLQSAGHLYRYHNGGKEL